MTKVIINSREFDLDAVISLMDDGIREQLHSEIAPCSDQEFVDAYLRAHAEKYGEEFAIN